MRVVKIRFPDGTSVDGLLYQGVCAPVDNKDIVKAMTARDMIRDGQATLNHLAHQLNLK